MLLGNTIICMLLGNTIICIGNTQLKSFAIGNTIIGMRMNACK